MLFTRKTLSLLILTVTLLLITAGISWAAFEGTVGTRFTITGYDPGINKPKVYIEYEKRSGVVKRIYAKVESWSNTDNSITCLWTKPVSPGAYYLKMKPGNRHAAPWGIGSFIVINPAVDSITPDTLSTGTIKTVNGRFFTNKKPTVYLKDPASQKRKLCRVLTSSMDPVTGESSLNFVMPKWGSDNFELVLQTSVGETSLTYPSNPIEHWHLRNSATIDRIFGVTYGNGIFVAVAESLGIVHRGTIITSPDGVVWTASISKSDEWQPSAIAYGNGVFVAVGVSGMILTSPNGIDWTPRISGIEDSLSGVIYSEGLFVVVGSRSTILTSPDGIEWTSRNTSGSTWWLSGVTYGNGMFMAVGASGIVFTSPDGIEWTSKFSGTNTGYLTGVTYGNGLFVAVGNNGVCDNCQPSSVILTSPNGVSWTSTNSRTNNNLFGITYGNGIFVVVGENGLVLTSSDGTSWSLRNSGTTAFFDGATYGNNTFLVVGDDGTIIQSDPIE